MFRVQGFQGLGFIRFRLSRVFFFVVVLGRVDFRV